MYNKTILCLHDLRTIELLSTYLEQNYFNLTYYTGLESLKLKSTDFEIKKIFNSLNLEEVRETTN